MMNRYIDLLLLLLTVTIHVFLVPYTKVEESFNLQASYDLIYKQWNNVSQFDHTHFPGVVPRTFIGPLIISVLTIPVQRTFQLSPIATLHLVRTTLAFLTAMSLFAVRNAIASRFSISSAFFFILITISQFHLMFYAGRTLPNTFALVLTNFAFAERLRLKPKHQNYIQYIILSVACALFRSELCIYIFFLLATDLLLQQLEVLKTCAFGILTATLTALTSIAIDSYFWQRLCYPELEVFYFNVVQNKSSAWGTQHSLWYFVNALPRALGGSYLLAIISIVYQFKKVWSFVLPTMLFISLYSALPHKELRFIFYTIPVFNVTTALLLDSIYREFRAGITSRFRKQTDISDEAIFKSRISFKSLILLVLRVCIVFGVLMMGCLQTAISVMASRENYPAAHAMKKLFDTETLFYASHQLCTTEKTAQASVHVDVESAMNGISQFVQRESAFKGSCPQWFFSKREDWENLNWSNFTHLITSRYHVPGFERIHTENIFNRIDYRELRLLTDSHIYVHRRQNLDETSELDGGKS